MLQTDDSGELMRIRRHALESAPTAFGSSVEQDRGLDPNAVLKMFSHPERSAVYGLVVESQKVLAMAGVVREAKEKLQHKAYIYGMFVSAEVRQQGHGRALLHATVEHTRRWSGVTQVHLTVSEDAPAAQRLYESYGFREWGREPNALFWNGEFFDEAHMVLNLL